MAGKSTGLLVTTPRSVPVRGPLTKKVSTACIARMLVLAAEDQQSPILASIHSPSGLAAEAARVLSTMSGIHCPVATFCLGKTGGAATIIAAHGVPGYRAASPSASFSFKFDSDGESHEDTGSYLQLLVEMLVRDTGRPRETVLSWFTSSADFSAQEALARGLIDVISAKPILPVAGASARTKPKPEKSVPR